MNRQSFSYSKISQYFMETKSSLPCSQQSAIRLYLELDESSPYHPKCNNKKISGAAQKQILVFSLSLVRRFFGIVDMLWRDANN
jgi:hypothetical protein